MNYSNDQELLSKITSSADDCARSGDRSGASIFMMYAQMVTRRIRDAKHENNTLAELGSL